MPGGLMQLVAYGAQDTYLSSNPQITFWKVLYKRHTNFAMESKRVDFLGTPMYGSKISAPLPRYADLITKSYLYVELPAYGAWATSGSIPTQSAYGWNNDQKRLGYVLFDYMDIEIGGQIVDKQYAQWMAIWSQVTSTVSKRIELDTLTGGVDKMAKSSCGTIGGTVYSTTPATDSSSSALVTGQSSTASWYSVDGNNQNTRVTALHIPLTFWFSRNPGLALPLVALQYHEVRINVQLASSRQVTSDPFGITLDPVTGLAPPNVPQLADIALMMDYVYLDTDERRRFAQQSHEYLIEQLQFSGDQQYTSQSVNIDMTLNHPIKELVWVTQWSAYLDCTDAAQVPTLHPISTQDFVDEAQLQLNGQERIEFRRGEYFNSVQVHQHHTGAGEIFPFVSAIDQVNYGSGVYFYSFAVKPEEHQPSGSCNFSRIDKATLYLKFRNDYTAGCDGLFGGGQYSFVQPTGGGGAPINVRIYAVNYNVLRVMSGMGGLAYSN